MCEAAPPLTRYIHCYFSFICYKDVPITRSPSARFRGQMMVRKMNGEQGIVLTAEALAISRGSFLLLAVKFVLLAGKLLLFLNVNGGKLFSIRRESCR